MNMKLSSLVVDGPFYMGVNHHAFSPEIQLNRDVKALEIQPNGWVYGEPIDGTLPFFLPPSRVLYALMAP